MKEKKLVHVGTFGQPQGLKGEIKINIFTSSFVSFKLLKKFFIEDEKSELVFTTLRCVGKKIIASVDECKDRDSALLFKGKHIFSFRESFPKININEYYIVDLIDCDVMDIKNNLIGTVADIQNFGAGDLIEINYSDKKSFYIPMNDENLVSVDTINKIIIVDPIKGLLEQL